MDHHTHRVLTSVRLCVAATLAVLALSIGCAADPSSTDSSSTGSAEPGDAYPPAAETPAAAPPEEPTGTTGTASPPPAASSGDDRSPPTASTDGSNLPDIRASRLFAGPAQYPPQKFAAYGILAFRSAVTSQSRLRYLAICEGYRAGLPSSASLEQAGVPLGEQMATVWPLDDSALADRLNAETGDGVTLCPDIVSSVNIITSREAIANASRANSTADFSGIGPYLIAWSPSSSFGQADTPVLVWNLSDVTTEAQATRMFADWAVEIERNPALWRDGWNREGLRTVLRLWADRWGSEILQLFGVGE